MYEAKVGVEKEESGDEKGRVEFQGFEDLGMELFRLGFGFDEGRVFEQVY